MANNIVAYIGMDCSDIIMYLSRVLVKLGKKVLVIDCTDKLALLSMVPKPVGIEYCEDIVTYRQVDYTAMVVKPESREVYDDILISYGGHPGPIDLSYCNRVVAVTDLFGYNQDWLREIYRNLLSHVEAKVALLIRDYIDTTVMPEAIIDRLNMPVALEDITVIYRDDKSYINHLLSSYNGIFRFHRISRSLKRFLKQEVRYLYPMLTMKELDVAYNQARKGV